MRFYRIVYAPVHPHCELTLCKRNEQEIDFQVRYFCRSSSKLFIRNLEELQHSVRICPSLCTDKLQTLDVTVNYDHKEMLKGGFTNSIPPYF